MTFPPPLPFRPIKLAEVWLVSPEDPEAKWDVQLRVIVPRGVEEAHAADFATTAVLQMAKNIQANDVRLASDERLEPPGA